MKNKFLFLFAFILITTFSFGQNANEKFSLRIGYSTTNITFNEAYNPSINFLGIPINLTGKNFSGDGPELGISKSIKEKLFLDIAFSSFYSPEFNQLTVNNYALDYTLKGFQIPLTINYLTRNSSKKFRVNLGGGLQYLNGHLQQFEKITDNGGQITQSTVTDVHISELQLSLRPGIQYRIAPNLVASFIVNTSISVTGNFGRYSDHPCLSLKYTFVKKKE
jgi:hypothetical protein